MAAHPISDADAIAACRALVQHKTQTAAAAALGISRGGLEGRLRSAAARGLTAASAGPVAPVDTTADRIRQLEAELKIHRNAAFDAEYVKGRIVKLGQALDDADLPAWLLRPKRAFKGAGVPTLFASDWHWGEVVDPAQIGGVNTYDMSIARERARTMVEVTVDLLDNHIVSDGGYPGIVLALGGDMVSGDIHEELSATNEQEMMPVIVDLWGNLVWVIEQLVAKYGRVFAVCVTGNHGRNTKKMRSKGRVYTSFDWLLYQFLAKRFEGDDRVKFLIPDGPDAYYSVLGHRYLLTHGDQFRGGDGMIGALGPIIRGDHRKRSRNAQIGMEYDTMLMGHWHQLIQLQRLIVNGSLKGYDEYANDNNFPYERPRQALWLTHPDHGITFSAPVNVDRSLDGKGPTPSWVAWTDAK